MSDLKVNGEGEIMKQGIRKAVLCLTAVVALASFGAASALAAIVVDQNAAIGAASCTGALTQYNTIQSAVSAASSGATIEVCPGTYAEQVTITTPLTLKGVTDTTNNAGAVVVTIPGGTFSGAFTQILIQATGVTLTDIGVDGTNTLSSCDFGPTLTGIMFASGSSGTLKDVALRNHYISNGSGGYCGTGIPVSANSAASVTVTDSSVRNFDSEGLNLTATSTVTVKTTTVAPITNQTANCVYANAATLVVSDNSMADCYVGVYVTSTVQGTVSGNTIHGGTNGSAGVFCFPTCTGLTISGNAIFDTGSGFGMKTSGGVGGVVFENNDVYGTSSGVYLYLQPGNTVSNNTFNDAQVGVYGASGNTVTGNTYRTVTTLTQ
jgi:parallel beta-helix repeat protein